MKRLAGHHRRVAVAVLVGLACAWPGCETATAPPPADQQHRASDPLSRRTCSPSYRGNALQPPAPAVSVEDQQAIDRLLDLMRQRLLLMHNVARWKWNQKLPITDSAREEALLDRLAREGQPHGLSDERTRRLFTAQIAAGKLMQQANFDAWKSAGQAAFADVPDLTTEQRPRIDRASTELLEALVDAQPLLEREDVNQWLNDRAAELLTGDGIDDHVREIALAGLRPVDRLSEAADPLEKPNE